MRHEDLSETDRRLNVESRLLAVLSDYGGQLIQSSPAMGRMIERMADAAEALAREGFLTPPADGFDPTTTPGAHEWFAAALRERESAAHPLSWPDRPDVYWCAGVAGGCDVYHRRDYPHQDVTADGMPVTVCAPTVDKDAPADPKPGPTQVRHDVGEGFFATRALAQRIRHDVEAIAPSPDAVVTLDFSRVEALTGAFADELVCNLAATGRRVVVAGANDDVAQAVHRVVTRRGLRNLVSMDNEQPRAEQ